jgi:succinoglycan biosynthesis protein ExoM
VDNDGNGADGIRVCEQFRNYRWSLEAVAENRKGISFARNRAISRALELGVDTIVFVDDDETPEPGWLNALLQMQRRSGAEAVAGPVVPEFEEEPPEWAVKGRFFERPRREDGASISFSGAGNLLLSAQLFTNYGLSFDLRYGLTGGEDTLLCLQMQQKGARLVWADTAVVREWIPPARVDARYILRRAFGAGSILARAEQEVGPGPVTVFRRIALALGGIVQGLLLLLPSFLLGQHAVIGSLFRISRGAGGLAGLFRRKLLLYE